MKITGRILLIPDVHAPYEDTSAYALMLKIAKSWRPTHTVVLGDFVDCYCVSSHDHDPARRNDLEWEVDYARGRLTELSDAVGGSKKYFIEGNHENRLVRYIWRVAPELNRLVTIRKLLRLDDLGFEFTPYKESMRIGKLSLTHDVGQAGQYAHIKAADTYGKNVAIGHTHRAGISYTGTVAGKKHFGAMLGWLGSVSKIDYMHKDRARKDWIHGVGAAYLLENGHVSLQFIPFIDGRAVLDGKVYE
jgi:predicted phosphodiesterase